MICFAGCQLCFACALCESSVTETVETCLVCIVYVNVFTTSPPHWITECGGAWTLTTRYAILRPIIVCVVSIGFSMRSACLCVKIKLTNVFRPLVTSSKVSCLHLCVVCVRRPFVLCVFLCTFVLSMKEEMVCDPQRISHVCVDVVEGGE